MSVPKPAYFKPARMAPRIAGIAVISGLLLAGCQPQTAAPPAAPPPGEVAVQPTAPVEPPAPPPAVVSEPSIPDPEPEPTSNTVALLLPLSGQNAALGAALLDAAQMAYFEVADESVDLVVLDTEGTASGARQAARTAIDRGAGLILGPVFAEAASALRPVIANTDVNVVSFSNDRTIAGEGIFVFGLLPDQQIRRIIGHAAGENRNSYAVVAPDGPYGDLVIAVSRSAVAAVGGTLLPVNRYDPVESDVTALIQSFSEYDRRRALLRQQKTALEARNDAISLKALQRLSRLETFGPLPYDSILLATTGADLRRIASLLAYYDVDSSQVQLLGTAIWDESDNIGTEPGLIGARYAATPRAARLVFESKFRQAYGAPPVRLASLGYDAMLLALALARFESGPDFSLEALTDPDGFAGVEGIFRFNTDGTNQRGLAVYEVQEDGVRIVDPSPASFEHPGY